MTEKLFNTVGVFTDIHFGLRSDSERHNQDCLEYIDWFLTQCDQYDVDTIIMMGDWFHNEKHIRLDTQWYSNQAIRKLTQKDRQIYFLVGNHDLWFKRNRKVHSLDFLNFHPNINLIDDITQIGDTVLCPWLIGQEHAMVTDYKAKYMFGHFELPLFLVNQMIEMPDHGGLHMDHFEHVEAVFSGHFHKRQIKTNRHGIPVTYIGNCFGHNMNDVHDRDRGCMILKHDEEPIYLNWTEGPNYNRTTLSELWEMIENNTLTQNYNRNSIVECRDDIGIELEEQLEIKAMLEDTLRDLSVKSTMEKTDINEETELDDEMETVDEIVVNHLSQLDPKDSNTDPELLVKMYEGRHHET